MLVFLDLSSPYTVVMNALGRAIGGLLMHDHGNGPCPIASLSLAIKPTFLDCERELVAIASYFVRWQYCLEAT